jgi:two-component system, NtrC family, sensor kinase
MKSIKSFLLLLFVGIHFCHAQDTTLLLMPNILDKDSMQIFISEMKGWHFKQGNDTAWAKKDIDLTGWKRMMPTELSEKMADKDDRLEGWFRIKIKPDSTFGETALGIRISTWAASDLYVDGKWIASFGNTGLNGAPYQEYRFAGNPLPVAVNLLPGNEYTIALHVVDYISPLPPFDLKAKELGLRSLMSVVIPEYYSTVLPEVTNRTYSSNIILAAVSAVLCLLFWLLFFQNRSEKNLLLFSLASSFLTISLIADAFATNRGAAYGGISYVGLWVCYQINVVFLLYFTLVPLILARIFKRRFSRIISFIFVLFLLYALAANMRFIVVRINIDRIISFLALFLTIITSIYYVVSSWKTLKGAQWAIVIGLMVPLSVLFTLVMSQFISPGITERINMGIVVVVIFLSFPFSLMIYVAMRFKEMIHDVQENAKQVVQMSEEKKEQAINQQKILQEEVTRQTAEIRTTLDHLRSTQSQLIQSEKMASLGELTAGIAHEIQNPLNFVNNFSEVSNELIGEMVDEVDKGNTEEVKSIAKDVQQNLEKILHHGKRADAIVKGMLQHSSSGSGKKEPTNINALADEYLRLAYHGLRAKDKSFNATMKTEFDETIGNINIIPQDIGRVILNLITNAFYVVNEKSKQGIAGYDPTVEVKTNSETGKVLIAVTDNGNGIPLSIRDKIFQPFFTTKPTGQGTGLGLSLSYDIVKAHGGVLEVISTDGKGSTFTISLPK